jgi:serine/threonine protein kinase/Flp pilus assembly protein TadD
MKSNTIRAAYDSTINSPTCQDRSAALVREITTSWRDAGDADLVSALRQHPDLLENRSLLLDLAVEEFKARNIKSDLHSHCARFREFGSSIQRSIFRLLEVQLCFDEHPEWLDVFSSPQWPQIGEEFGDFHILEELGRGALARVYLCLQRELGDRQVVIKATPLAGFEAAILGRLNHAHIIPIHSVGFVAEYGLHYLCMPFCGRSTLADLIEIAFECGWPRRDLTIDFAANRGLQNEKQARIMSENWLRRRLGGTSYVDAVVSLAIQIADALTYAHCNGVLHGDLKPSNILLTTAGSPMLLDFNLSKDIGQLPEMRGGTLPYMPPEQLAAVAGENSASDRMVFDSSCDIYSFGAVLYELFTGVTPVDLGESHGNPVLTAKRILAQLASGISPLQQHNPLVSRSLEAIVLRCLSSDRKLRPASMSDVMRLLKRERNSLSAVARFARVRPAAFSALLVLPLLAVGSTLRQVVFSPPAYAAAFENGLHLASQGKGKQAAQQFLMAAEASPSFVPARFQLGRIRISLGQFDLAISDFRELVNTTSDMHSMTYLGYCFNLRGVHAAAIPWYERAIQNGAHGAAINNNLGASYTLAQTQRQRREQLCLAGEHLEKARHESPESRTIALNLIRLSLAHFKLDPAYDTTSAWTSAKLLFPSASSDPVVRLQLASWRKTLPRHRSDGAAIGAKVDSELAENVDRRMPKTAEPAYGRNGLELSSQPSTPPMLLYFMEPHSVGTDR